MKNEKYSLISVVMLNYNGLKYLKKTIHPILKLDYSNYEFIIVDNGSTDGSIKYIKKFKKIRLIENGENLGYSQGKNIGVKNAKGEYVLLLDNDIKIIHPQTLNKLINIYTDQVGFLQIPFLDVGKNKTSYYGLFPSLYGFNLHKKEINIKKIINLKEDLIKILSPTGGVMFFNKKIWVDVGGLDESQKFNIDDIDIGTRIYLKGYTNYLYTKDYLIHLGVTNTKNNQDYINRFKLLFSGHFRSIVKTYGIINLLLRFPFIISFYFIKAIRYSFKKEV